MMNMEKTYADECSPESLDRGKNTYGSTSTWEPTRSIEEIEEEAKIEAIAKKVGLTEGETMTEGIPEKVMIELSSYYDPISVWISRKRLTERDEETFY